METTTTSTMPRTGDRVNYTVTHIPGNWTQAAEMLSAVLDVLRRNERTGDGA